MILIWKLFLVSSVLTQIAVCTINEYANDKSSRQNSLLIRHPRAAGDKTRKSSENIFGSVLYFSGSGECVRVKSNETVIPNTEFTAQFWVKPEGGQYRYTPILGVFNECKGSNVGWTVSIMLQNDKRRDARVAFALFTEAAETMSYLIANKPYQPNTWTHVAISYDGKTMKLYINGAETSLLNEQRGLVFNRQVAKCMKLVLGGLPDKDVYYRGKLDEFGFWDRALDHSKIVDNMNKQAKEFREQDGLVLMDSFDNLKLWDTISDEEPKLMTSDITLPHHSIRLEAPPCGKTVCDDPGAVLSYLSNPDLLHKKQVRYRFINILNDEGKNPIIPSPLLFEQHRALSKAFEPYNITFEFEQYEIKNSSLRKRVIMFNCAPYMVGNGECDPECAHSTTGNDGGDCDQLTSECNSELLGNGLCNAECNKVYYRYDGGDCCLPGEQVHITCIDPNSQHRAYLNVEDLKMTLQLESSNIINVFPITSSWDKAKFHGIATYPWEKNVYTSIGGIIMHAAIIGKPGKLKSLVHEFGHSFGLWHVYRGISELSCDDPCTETRPSMVVGDLCSDTNPTPKNSQCKDPLPNPKLNNCGVYRFQDTPFKNYMSYSDDNCTNHFTPQQVARMHCYLDLVYQPMRGMKLPAPIPVAPKIISADEASIQIAWLEPLGTNMNCDSENSLHQYAQTATASHSGVRWAPHEATGFPDAEKCTSSKFTWKPYHSETHPKCEKVSCWIELGFKEAVVPKSVSIWIVDIRVDSAIYVELIGQDGEISTEIGEIPAYCDMETTILLDSRELIAKVKIYTKDNYVAIDAVEIVSQPDYPSCTNRKLPKYRVTREPAFTGGYVVTADTKHIDRTVQDGITYNYRVQSVIDSRTSVQSPKLVYTHGQPFCGDGTVNGNEGCDDKNAIDGDGCSLDCKIEEGFQCSGSRSLCRVIHKRNNTCGDDDCELSTPKRFIDQWAFDAKANPEYQYIECPASAIIGKPKNVKICESIPRGEGFWRPCGEQMDVNGDFWIEISIYKPVVATSVIIHLASDGRNVFNQEPKSMHVQLLTTEGTPIDLQAKYVRCEDNPVEVPVVQDLSKPFFLTKGVRISFTYSTISIYAVRVRSSPSINPAEILSCNGNKLYNQHFGVCVRDSCSRTPCGEFPVKYGEALCKGKEDGSTCKIACDQGYFVDGHENGATCVDGAWISSTPLRCLPVDCGKPSIQMATVACPNGTTFSKQCQFKCDKPAALKGEYSSITCLKTGRWSTPSANCTVQCEPLERKAFKNGELKTSSCLKEPQSVGHPCKVRCQDGYHVEGERNKRHFLRIICDNTGTWSGPECVPNVCPALPTMFAGAYKCTGALNSGSTCTMTCASNSSIVQSMYCTAEGEWNNTFRICPSDISKLCSLPVSTEQINFDCSERAPGSKCKVFCKNKEHIPVLKTSSSSSSSTVANKTFEYINRVECTVVQSWEPNPNQIKCVEKCLEKSIGNGLCEATNNRDVCVWDGGDCCPSTVHGGVVLTIPEDCSEECSCIDPAASENLRRRRRHKHGYEYK